MPNPQKVPHEPRLGSVSVDMDSVRLLYEQRGMTPAPGIKINASYTISLPRFLKLFREEGILATFFVNANDLIDNPETVELLKQALAEGHEIANHGFAHRPRLSHAERSEIEHEVKLGHQTLERLLNIKPVGFRAPDYNASKVLLDVLEDEGYLYDTSVMPTYFRWPFQFLHWVQNRFRRQPTLGWPWTMMFSPIHPYRLGEKPGNVGMRNLIELPVSVTPVFRIPFWANSYLKFGRKTLFQILKGYEKKRAPYFQFVMHAVDMLDFDDIGDTRLSVKSGVSVPYQIKNEEWRFLLQEIKPQFQLKRCDEIAKSFADQP